MNILQTCYTIFFAMSLITTLNVNVAAESLALQSSENQVALLELFTSEGCSSCPPAETWLTGLTGAAGLWRDFVPLAFHVDYWDYLGWRDPWGSETFSDRQRAYAQQWRSDSIYTPGFVLNGQEWRAWVRDKNGPKASATKAGVLQLNSADLTRWQVTFSPVRQDIHDYEVHSVVLSGGLISDVKSGENQGRRLHHDFVVIAAANSALTMSGEKAQGEFELRAGRKEGGGRQAVAAWVTRRGHLAPLQAVGGWLPATH